MSLLADYLKEKGVKEILETEDSFATYFFMPEGCYVEDIYVAPRSRATGLARKLLDQITMIAKERGCTQLFGSCVPLAINSTDSLSAAFKYGFKLHSAKDNFIVYKKDI